MLKLYPDYYAKDVGCIGSELLSRMGIQALMLDIDNTLALVDAPDPEPHAKAWVEDLKRAGFPMGVISNNDEDRVRKFAGTMGLPYRALSHKPSPAGFLEMAEEVGVSPHHCLVVGDQLFTDILGGKAAGMRTILVAPLSKKREPAQFWLRRQFERLLLGWYRITKRQRCLTEPAKQTINR